MYGFKWIHSNSNIFKQHHQKTITSLFANFPLAHFHTFHCFGRCDKYKNNWQNITQIMRTHKNISATVCTPFSVRFRKICLEPIDSSIAKYFELALSVASCGSKPSRKYHVSRGRCLRRCGTLELTFGIAPRKRGLFCGLDWGPGKTTLSEGCSFKTTLARGMFCRLTPWVVLGIEPASSVGFWDVFCYFIDEFVWCCMNLFELGWNCSTLYIFCNFFIFVRNWGNRIILATFIHIYIYIYMCIYICIYT